MTGDTKKSNLEWDALEAGVQGTLVRPGDDSYDEARAIWNGRIDRRPAAILQCAKAADAAVAVVFARDRGLPLSIRGGGHDYAGNSVCDGGLVIDLSAMNSVGVDPESKTAEVQAGAKWSAVDQATQAHGLATVGGTVSSVGVAGFTLGGGMGHLTRLHGLAADNLLSAEVVTAQGKLVRASESENSDLFWALRGGGGNFGVVTSFEFGLHEIGPDVLSGQMIYPIARAGEALRKYRECSAKAPDEMTCYAFIIRIPPIPAFPERHHGELAIDLVVVHAGDPDEGCRLIEPMRSISNPILDFVDVQPYLLVQQTFDAGVPPGLRWYSRSSSLDSLSDEAIDTILGHADRLAGPYTMVYLMPSGGAAARVAPDATAFPHRSAGLFFHILTGWTEAEDDDRNMSWTRSFHRAMRNHAAEGVYVNLLSEDEESRVAEAYGPNLERLRRVKRKWDPDNLFRMNHNVFTKA